MTITSSRGRIRRWSRKDVFPFRAEEEAKERAGVEYEMRAQLIYLRGRPDIRFVELRFKRERALVDGLDRYKQRRTTDERARGNDVERERVATSTR